MVGGSIAGCAAALAVSRAGAAEVVVYERTAGRLADRGVGVALHSDRYAELEAAGYVDAAMPWLPLTHRPWVVRDGSRRAGRAIAVLPFPFRSYNWGSLWRGLRARIPDTVDYRGGAAVTAVVPAGDGAVLRLAEGGEERFDLVVGADGYRSVVREAVDPGAVPAYGGYLAWRGTLPAERLPGPADAFREQDLVTVVFPGGHMVVYRIPASAGPGADVNWVFFTAPPDAAGARFADPAAGPDRVVDPLLARHQGDLVERHFPPFWQEVVRGTRAENAFLQPMYDLATPRFAHGRLVLLGDAASLARPHTGSGAIKALQDATVLERVLRETDDLDGALRRYDAERAPLGHQTLVLGRQLGLAQVQRTPDWAAMDQPAVERWWRSSGALTGFGGHALPRRPVP
ncbi:FAD-dependent monooxygenase [Kitasatospora sp. HUAS MG31]|uniref:FAD-dependent monooxygenase n=1 Tax=Kitasatospora camelliae TaxID=3156397 RepID=A0AAU8K6A3_9ACTN